MGSPDPRFNAFGKIDFRLHRQLPSYTKSKNPLKWVKPVPVQVLLHAVDTGLQHRHPESQAIANMTTIGYFYLKGPGKYTFPTAKTKPFHLQDIQLMIGAHFYSADVIPMDVLNQATFALNEFTVQKNAVWGKVVGQGRSGAAHFCLVQATVERVCHLCQHNAPKILAFVRTL
jgi:hypothetical protein